MLKKIKSIIVENSSYAKPFEGVVILMLKIYKKLKESLLIFFSYFMPGLTKHIEIQRHINQQMPTELLLMKGDHHNICKSQSILYFSVPRCATRYIKTILQQLAKDTGMSSIDIEGYFWKGGRLHTKPETVYKKNGYIYGPFLDGIPMKDLGKSQASLETYKTYYENIQRVPIPNIEDYKIVLMLRDPRDVLTSYYYYHANVTYYNPANQEIINARSKQTLSKTVDEWVLEKSEFFLETYKVYYSNLIGKPNTYLLRYEDMVHDFSHWLYQLTTFTGLNVRKGTLESIIEKANFKVDKENSKAHKRQVTPGDHKKKLKPETINTLNAMFSEIIDVLDYGK